MLIKTGDNKNTSTVEPYSLAEEIYEIGQNGLQFAICFKIM
jgi:hypothetical protein